MGVYIDTFKRYEIKYLLDEKQYRELRGATSDRLVPDQYGKSTISNIYFDTPDYRLIRASLEKPVYKEKLRLRSYKTPGADDTVFIELKKKYKGIVYKRRIDLPLSEAESYLYDRKPIAEPTQISREIDWVLDFYPQLGPATALFYDRTALYDKLDENFRVTFDSRLLARQSGLRLSDGPGGIALIAPDQRLMEIKTVGAIPLWMAKLLDELKIYPTSFSKYGCAYQLALQSNTLPERKIICA